MYVLIGEKTYTAPQGPNSRGLWVVPQPQSVVQDAPVALFTTKKKAVEYAESVMLVEPVYALVNSSYKITRLFFKKSVLDGFTSYRIQKHRKQDLPTNPHPRKRVRR